MAPTVTDTGSELEEARAAVLAQGSEIAAAARSGGQLGLESALEDHAVLLRRFEQAVRRHLLAAKGGDATSSPARATSRE